MYLLQILFSTIAGIHSLLFFCVSVKDGIPANSIDVYLSKYVPVGKGNYLFKGFNSFKYFFFYKKDYCPFFLRAGPWKNYIDSLSDGCGLASIYFSLSLPLLAFFVFLLRCELPLEPFFYTI